MKLRLPQSFYNTISYAGASVALIALFMFIFLYVLSSISTIDKAYVGIVIFIVIPCFIILGLLLIPVGMALKIRREKREGAERGQSFPILNLNLRQHRNGTLIFAAGTTVLLFLSALGSYEAYHFTESNRFCGTLCHTLMSPEYTAYQLSPHARVKCAECHIGAGASWYVKSKLSGLGQVYATLTNSYPRPIPTPIENLRPARETCEQCHWPQKVYGKQQRREIYFLPDEENTRWEIDMLVSIGAGNPALGQSEGIHWHINPDIRIEYAAADEERSVIPRVILTDLATGEKTLYQSDGAEQTEAEPRLMDCIDCHNRPSHIYNDPSDFINASLAAGEVDASLPGIKRIAVEACLAEYDSRDQAMTEIEAQISSFYRDNHAAVYSSRSAEIEKSIAGVQNAYSNNIFPAMKVRWEHYPDHIGHMTSAGCYRCHDGMHVSEDGRIITNRCDDCHLITAQGIVGQLEYADSQQALEFRHPVDIDGMWREAGCYECHSVPPL